MSSETRVDEAGPADLPVIADDMPVLFEDRGQDDMGEADLHTDCDQILTLGLRTHLAGRPELRVFSNLNWYYHPTERTAYVSPDLMVVRPTLTRRRVRSYRSPRDGPAPQLCVEILSRRSGQQQDLTTKPIIYSRHGVAEYILVDPEGRYLRGGRLLIRRLEADGRWRDDRDPDGGVTSALGFRIGLEADDLPRVSDAATGRHYLRPGEAEQARGEAEQARRRARQAEEQAEQERRQAEQARREADQSRRQTEAADAARQAAEERVRQLEAELARLRRPPEATP
jgi:Uma2 family endonuclease